MPRLNLTHLPAKLKSRKANRAGTRVDTFKRDDAVAEDRKRARLIRRTLPALPKPERKRAKRLTRLLQYDDVPPPTLASSAYYYDVRERVLDHLVRLTWQLPEKEVAVAALLPRRSRVCKLLHLDPAKFVRRLCGDLNRQGGRRVDGAIFASMHGEHDDGRGEWDPHYHLLIIGSDMIRLVAQLRERGKYKVASVLDIGDRPSRAAPIRIARVRRDELRYALSYILQTWWPGRWTRFDADGVSKRSGERRRIRGVHHTEWLLWMDRQQAHRMYLLYGLEVGRKGLRISDRRKKYINNEGVGLQTAGLMPP